MREQRRDLVPALRGLGPLQLEGLGDGLTGDGELQGQAPGMQGGLRAWRSRLLWPGVDMVGMREQGSKGGGDERGMPERLQGTRPFGVDRVQPVHRLVQPHAQFDLPAHAVEVGDLPRAEAGWEICPEEAVALGALDPHEAPWQRVGPAADMDIGETVAVVIMAMTLSFLATLYPSWRAARLDPVEALRYE